VSLLENEFEKLLKFLEDEKEKTGPKTAPIKINDRPSFESFKESDFRSDVYTPRSSASLGFDKNRFEKRCKDALAKEHIDRQQYNRPHVAVTDLLKCVRQNFYYRCKYNVNMDKLTNFSYLKMYADVGTAVHEFIQKVYDFKEIKVPVISKLYKIKGEADAASDPYLFEIKTVEQKDLKETEYRQSDYYQGNIYAHVLNSEYGYNFKKVTLIYVFRDNLRKGPYAIDLDVNADLAISFLSRGPILLDAVESNKLPDKIGASDDNCRYCLYKDYCDNEVISDVKYVINSEAIKPKNPEKKIPERRGSFSV
jgi:CRISPR/Cas system-associated exonuclease Cas4 (RecB family)